MAGQCGGPAAAEGGHAASARSRSGACRGRGGRPQARVASHRAARGGVPQSRPVGHAFTVAAHGRGAMGARNPSTPSFFTSKVRQYAYVNPAGCTSFFSLSRTIRALRKFQMCRVCHGGCVVRLLRMKRRDSPPGRAQTGGHDDPTFVTSAP